jgi:hypothetical protein
MDFATYWLIAPLILIGLTVPFWAYLLVTRHKHHHRSTAGE